MKKRIEVIENYPSQTLLDQFAKEFSQAKVLTGQVYYLFIDDNITNEIEINEALADSVLYSTHNDFNEFHEKLNFCSEVTFKPGVNDNAAKVAKEAILLVNKNLKENQIKVFSGTVFYFSGNLEKSKLNEFIVNHFSNHLLHKVKTTENIKDEIFDDFVLPLVDINNKNEIKHFDPQESIDYWKDKNNENCWALLDSDLEVIRAYYQSPKIIEERKSKNLNPFPSDIEIEIIAQTWSEHCKHRIFSSTIYYNESINEKKFHSIGSKKIESLFKTYIKKSTKEVEKNYEIPWLSSVFDDNAGMVRFDKNLDLSIKVETHNSPSALDPYGGAMTGILGVNRDILGVGMGARPIANTNVLCFGDQNLSQKNLYEKFPENTKHPKDILKGVHKGIEDGGNRSGIPTVNGAFVFDEGYTGKPLVYCGTIGVSPVKTNDGRDYFKKHQKVNDLIVMAGGLVGADGIHGATFSSMEINKDSPLSAVQIGDPFTQKRLTDFTLKAIELNLYNSITDNGAGGLSSSVGEMATFTGGARLDIEKIPTKYPGLKPFEIVISESQERMTYSVSPEKIEEFLDLANSYDVEANVIGEFNDSGNFSIYQNDQLLASLNMDFLHDGESDYQLNATFNGPVKVNEIIKKNKLKINEKSFEEIVKLLLKTPNITSKEEYVRQFDHEVKGSTVLKPFDGKNGHGVNNGSVISLEYYGGEKNNGIAVGCGINPKLSHYDGYIMAQFAIDEAVRNVVACGGDPRQLVLVDNFCWPDPIESAKTPDGKEKLGVLVRCCEGLYDMSLHYGHPFVSGKDSMKNDVIGVSGENNQVKVSVLPTLLVTAMAKVHDIGLKKDSSFKLEEDLIYLLGKQESGLIGSEYSSLVNISELENHVPAMHMKSNIQLYQLIHDHLEMFQSLHDVSDGGIMTSICEAAIANELGFHLKVDMDDNQLNNYFFNEGPGRFIVSINPRIKNDFENIFKNECKYLGKVIQNNCMVTNKEEYILNQKTLELKEAFLKGI